MVLLLQITTIWGNTFAGQLFWYWTLPIKHICKSAFSLPFILLVVEQCWYSVVWISMIPFMTNLVVMRHMYVHPECLRYMSKIHVYAVLQKCIFLSLYVHTVLECVPFSLPIPQYSPFPSVSAFSPPPSPVLPTSLSLSLYLNQLIAFSFQLVTYWHFVMFPLCHIQRCKVFFVVTRQGDKPSMTHNWLFGIHGQCHWYFECRDNGCTLQPILTHRVYIILARFRGKQQWCLIKFGHKDIGGYNQEMTGDA